MVNDVKGNILQKTGVGSYSYTNTSKPYAVTGISPTGNAIPTEGQDITYSSFWRPATISEGIHDTSFEYNDQYNRTRMTLQRNDTTILTRYYLGDCYEQDVTSGSTKEKLYLGGDYYSAYAVLIKDSVSGVSNVYHILRDHLGSITHVVDNNGNVVQELSYDAWGRLRNPATQQIYAPDSIPDLFLGRGYTGHEHLPWFGLINMNARLYDPTLGRFLSGDPEVLDMEDLQCLNRYTYCLNNPLAYVDPTGETIWVTYDWTAQQYFDRNYWKGYIQMNWNDNFWWWFGEDAYGHGAVYYNDETNYFMKWVGDTFYRVHGEMDWNRNTWNTYQNSSQTESNGYSGGSKGRTSGRSSNSSMNTIRTTFSVTGNANSITEHIYNNMLKTSQKSKIVHDVKKNLKNNYDIKIKTKTSEIYREKIPAAFKNTTKVIAATTIASEMYNVFSDRQIKPSNVVTVGLGVVGAIYSSPIVVGVIVGYSVLDGIYGTFSGNNMADDMIEWRYDF